MPDKYKRASIYITLPDGTKKQLIFTGKTQKEADAKKAKAKAEYEPGLLVVNANTTLAKWTDEWFETYRRPKMSKENAKQILSMMKRVYVDKIGGMKISSIRLVHVQRCINDLGGSSKSLIDKAYGNIRNLFSKALANGLINSDPTVELEKPTMRQSPGRRALTPEERAIFLEVMPQHKYGVFFGIMYACGLRPQEARALTVFSVDKDVMNITVNSAIDKADKAVKMPKTNAGCRIIPIPDWYRPYLSAVHREALSKRQTYLFQRKNGQYLDKQTYLRAWHSFLNRMDIAAGAQTYRNKIIVHVIDRNLDPYHLRHTYATELAEKEVPIRTAQYLLGHKNISVTAQIYTHVTECMREDARNRIDMCR